MDTLVRNTTLRFSRRADGYEPLDQGGVSGGHGGRDGGDHAWTSTYAKPRSSRRNLSPLFTSNMTYSYRRDRARKRQIFLQSYKFEDGMNSRGKSRTSKKVKKFVVKIKSVLVSAVSFVRVSTLNSCSCRAAISASSPARVARCC